MAISYYMDHNVPRAITVGLRMRGVDVVTAYDDKKHELDDPDLLDRAGALGRILFTRDYHFLQEAARRQGKGEKFTGIVYAHQLEVSIGRCIADLELIAEAADYAELESLVLFLPI